MTNKADRVGEMTTRAKGFTLIELMIVLAIIAIIAAIAIPAYGRYAFRAHRVDGQELLLRIANAQERFYSTNNVYGSLADMDFDDTSSSKGYYTAAVVVAASPAGSASAAFVATATGVGGQAQDVCGPLTIDDTGNKTPGPASASSNSNGSCW